MTDYDAQEARIEAILGEDESLTFDDAVEKFYEHLRRFIQLPCDVTGVEDFRWGEYYVLVPGSLIEYQKLRETQPSYQDIFELRAIENDVYSEWKLFHDEVLAGHVWRKSDSKEFYLGLTEIEPVDKESVNYQLLNDYSVWFANNR